MAEETATNLGDGDGTASAIVADDMGVEANDQVDAQQFDESGNPIESEPEEDEEIELDTDLKFKAPKAIAEKLKELKDGNLRQADYTRKTQELAEERKAVQVERETVQQASQAEMQAHASVIAIDQQIAQYQAIDWQAWAREDPFAAQEARYTFDGLKDARQQAANQFIGLRQQRALAQQQDSAKRIEEGAKALADPKTGIKGWSPDYAAKLLETGMREYGFERSEIESFEDHRMVRVLDDAAKWREHLAKEKKAASVAKGQEVTPAITLRGASGRGPVKADTKDFAAFEKLASKTT